MSSKRSTSKTVYVICGPNGAGKTTFAHVFLPQYAKCDVFVNADLIAGGLAPLAPHDAAIQAGKLVLQKIQSLWTERSTFGFETTLSGKNYRRLLLSLKKKGYQVQMIYLWLPVDLAIQRIEERVQRGGHFVPEKDVRRRYKRGLTHLFDFYWTRMDVSFLIDNSGQIPEMVAMSEKGKVSIVKPKVFDKIKASYE